ncbi:MAG TPA: hypothetical protein ENN23_09525 [Deltaproteobacteria bacterium]|nr:hypothetical protein [Deltaproteobacteria bacterium]
MPESAHLIRFIWYTIVFVSVPSFILISLYFFSLKISESGDYWKKRLLKLFQIYVFWTCVQFILYVVLGGELPLPWKTFFRSGGPALSYGTFLPPMPSIFYYLYVLIICAILALLFTKLPDKIKPSLSIVIVLGICIYYFYAQKRGIVIDTHSMKNFFIYIPVAYYLCRYKEKFIQYRLLFFILYILTATIEYIMGGASSAFGRTSIFFGTLLFVSVFISGWSKANRPILFLSKYTLGIFALHPYWIAVVRSAYSLALGRETVMVPQSFTEGIVTFAVVLILTCISAWLIGKTRLRMYVS